MKKPAETSPSSASIIGPTSPFSAGSILHDAALELLWPTRCAICDQPGTLLCDSCKRALRFTDPWLACPHCGAPYGRFQCCDCNTHAGRAIPSDRFFSCSSCLIFDDASARLIRCFKDAGEQRIGALMAEFMARTLSPDVLKQISAVVYVPDSPKAFVRRGYDHMHIIAHHLSQLLGIPVWNVFERPVTNDQRGLDRAERQANMEQVFRLRKDNQPDCIVNPAGLLLIDDVYTTGATMMAARQALLQAFDLPVFGLTFARVV